MIRGTVSAVTMLVSRPYDVRYDTPMPRKTSYWFIHIDNVDTPDTLEYSVDIVAPQTIYFITMHLGFRIEPKISVYLRHIVEDLVADGNLDLVSSYHTGGVTPHNHYSDNQTCYQYAEPSAMGELEQFYSEQAAQAC